MHETPDTSEKIVKNIKDEAVLTLNKEVINKWFAEKNEKSSTFPFDTVCQVTGAIKNNPSIGYKTEGKDKDATKKEIYVSFDLYMPEYAAVDVFCRFTIVQKDAVLALPKGHVVTVRGQLKDRVFSGTSINLDGCILK